jgi:hypothetical protein
VVDFVVTVLLVLNRAKQALDNVMLFVLAFDELALSVDNMFEQVVVIVFVGVAVAGVAAALAAAVQQFVGDAMERLLFELSSELSHMDYQIIKHILHYHLV